MSDHWTLNSHYIGADIKVDPRAIVANHIGWQPPRRCSTGGWQPTTAGMPEPDIYNYGIFDYRAYDFDTVKEQVFFRYRKGWISLYYILPEEKLSFTLTTRNIKPWGFWTHRGTSPRRSATLLERDTRLNAKELTENEILYEQNYYNRLAERAEDPAIILNRVGMPTNRFYQLIEQQNIKNKIIEPAE